MVVYERLQYKALTENLLGVLERWSLMGGGRLTGGGHTWRVNCRSS